jgi:hypothetical protein
MATLYKRYPHSMEVKVIIPSFSFIGHNIQKLLKYNYIHLIGLYL